MVWKLVIDKCKLAKKTLQKASTRRVPKQFVFNVNEIFQPCYQADSGHLKFGIL